MNIKQNQKSCTWPLHIFICHNRKLFKKFQLHKFKKDIHRIKKSHFDNGEHIIIFLNFRINTWLQIQDNIYIEKF